MEFSIQNALLLYKQGDLANAAVILKQLIKENPQNSEAWFGLALCTTNAENKIKYLQQTLKYNPGHTKAHALLQQTYQQNQNAFGTPQPTPAVAHHYETEEKIELMEEVEKHKLDQVSSSVSSLQKIIVWGGGGLIVLLLLGGAIWFFLQNNNGQPASPTPLPPTAVILPSNTPAVAPTSAGNNAAEQFKRTLTAQAVELKATQDQLNYQMTLAAPPPTAVYIPPTEVVLPTPIPQIIPTITPVVANPIARLGEWVESKGVAMYIMSAYQTGVIDTHTPAEGNVYLVIEVVLQNAARDVTPYNYLYFTLRDVRNYQFLPLAYAPDPLLANGNINLNEQAHGFVAFEIPQNSIKLVVEYKPLLYLGDTEMLRIALD